MSLKHVLSFMGLVNLPGAPKLWAIAHENGPQMQKRRVFGHATQTCTKSHGPCKSPYNPKTVGNLMKTAINAKTMSFWSYHSNMY
jgi:hypothetical protein